MPPFIDLELYKADIISLFHQDCSTARIASIHTIKTRLSSWDVSKYNYTVTIDFSLHNWIKKLFFEKYLSDTENLYTIQTEGYTQICTEQGLLLFTYIYNKYLIIPRYWLYNIYYIITPEAI
ncbi:uncharacterized protein BO88DRAFT_428889 [Aspergillus vadensis CBS 113365]|uniref:Uncharacterized protein n=1 Tax=Aspergillus vadensis (strain CBS 113365 / IMI 142717 / IBT 24658) TaxID=1448311 RepID=A0A319B075_ASPVC|nr:hypothetical protein BO88DRAFT_428889 [Aspergillus vadensis CBS 113365]PYH65224.1 hypothetical protein BO88DRAFT_428889 [Aspergillus vadensis CBS 113365]